MDSFPAFFFSYKNKEGGSRSYNSLQNGGEEGEKEKTEKLSPPSVSIPCPRDVGSRDGMPCQAEIRSVIRVLSEQRARSKENG